MLEAAAADEYILTAAGATVRIHFRKGLLSPPPSLPLFRPLAERKKVQITVVLQLTLLSHYNVVFSFWYKGCKNKGKQA